MQLIIDLSTRNDPARLRIVAAMLIACAAEQDGLPSVPSGTVETPPAPAPAAQIPPPPVPPAPPVAHAGPATAPAESVAVPPSVPTTPPALVPAPPTSVTTATAPANARTVDPNAQLDKRGFPFDERIHSGKAPGTINKSDGLWRTRRGVDNALIESVEAELKARGYGVAVPPAPLTPPAANVPPPPSNVPQPPPASSVPLPPGATDSGGAGSVPAGNQVDPFRELMNAVSGHTGPDGKLRREIMGPIYSRILNREGAGLPDFHKARDKIPEVLVEVRRILAA